MEILIQRENTEGGGEDVITLADLLRAAGHFGKFTIKVVDNDKVPADSDDIFDGEPVLEYQVSVLSQFGF